MTQLEAESRVVHRWDGGLGWMAHPDEMMRRASQAIVGEHGVWLVDPLDMPGLAGVLDPLGDVVGIVISMDRHTRDADTLASRYDVPVHLPADLASLGSALAVPTASLEEFTVDTGFEPISVVDLPWWREYALYDATDGTVILADALGTATHFRAPGERIGVHPMLRLFPPRSALGHVTADRVLVGHGPGLLADGTPALQDALAGAPRRAPRLYLQMLGQLPKMFFGNLRS